MTHGYIVVLADDVVVWVEDDTSHWVVIGEALRGAGEVFLAQSDHIWPAARHHKSHTQPERRGDD